MHAETPPQGEAGKHQRRSRVELALEAKRVSRRRRMPFSRSIARWNDCSNIRGVRPKSWVPVFGGMSIKGHRCGARDFARDRQARLVHGASVAHREIQRGRMTRGASFSQTMEPTRGAMGDGSWAAAAERDEMLARIRSMALREGLNLCSVARMRRRHSSIDF